MCHFEESLHGNRKANKVLLRSTKDKMSILTERICLKSEKGACYYCFALDNDVEIKNVCNRN